MDASRDGALARLSSVTDSRVRVDFITPVPIWCGEFISLDSSISVYNERGFFEQNEFDKYVINSRTTDVDEDGGTTINFGGDPNQLNFLPIMPGWTYVLRIYLPQASYFDGSWKAPAAQLVE